MRITAIRQQEKRAHRVNVFVDEVYAFSLSLDQLASSGLKAGDEIDDQQILDWKELSQQGKLKERAVKWAMRRDHSRAEISNYIKRRTDQESQFNTVYDYLASMDFVDDERFAENWTAQRRGKGYSSLMIKRELFQKGVDRELVNKLLEGDDDLAALRLLVEKKRRLNRYQDRQKLIAYLSSRGFSYDHIKRVLD